MIFPPSFICKKKGKKKKNSISKFATLSFRTSTSRESDAIMRSLGIIPDGIDVTIMTVVNTLQSL